MMSLIYYPISLLNVFLLLQVPQGVPNPANSEPLTLETPFDYILFVGMPILIFIGYLFWRRRKKQREKEKEENNNNLK
jgi:hypothetical protein